MGQSGKAWISRIYSYICMPNKLQLLECSSTLTGESIQRVDCADFFSGCHLTSCCLLNGKRQKAGWGVHGKRLGLHLLAEEFAAGYRMWRCYQTFSKSTVWSFTARRRPGQLLHKWYELLTKAKGSRGLEDFLITSVCCCCCCCAGQKNTCIVKHHYEWCSIYTFCLFHPYTFTGPKIDPPL